MKNTLPIIVAGLCALSACGGGSAASPAAPVPVPPAPAPVTPAPPAPPAMPAGGVPASWRLVWSDEFDVAGLPDPAKWDYDTSRNKQGWHNNELQYYSRARLDNSRVADGKLVITALKEKLTGAADYGGQSYTSARLFTRGKIDWTYGYFEIRAKLPCGLGTWPAIWTLGSKGAWPADGEIDIMEHVGKTPGQVLGSVHTGAYNWPMNTQKTVTTTVADACDAFHNYQLRWDAEQVVIGVDNRNFFQFVNPKDGDNAKWPFSNPQYLLLNVALGGDLGGPVDDAIFPVQMEVEYVRVYQP
ncbi:glycoside hydrolase family 16 protein [Massilia glaciei]|uniref:glycoside hydrolase family 16 protein n=1 Tax=Massilia glaciei TaxID=1524097 RepID=UPI001E495291|nr:glycoside hydrolase family 16 protein [Massilia glaciei]